MGVKAVESHMKSEKHRRYASIRKSTVPMESYVSVPNTSSTPAGSQTARFGIAPFIKRQLTSKINDKSFIVMFDESMNRTTKNKQLDLHVRYWTTDETGTYVCSRYYGSEFLGHSTAEDLLDKFKEGTKELCLSKMLSLSMDGPNVNWRFVQLLQQEYSEQFGGAQIQIVRSCGLHIMHNSIKAGFGVWQVEKLLKALHFLFHCAPARRQDYSLVTKSTKFPLPFCGHRWLENLPAVQRAIEIWPSVVTYVDQVKLKKLPNPGSPSYDTVAEARMDPLTVPKLHYFMSTSLNFQPFLTKHQTDVPVIPFLCKDLEDLVRSLLRRFIKRDVLLVSVPKLVRLDVTDQSIWVSPKAVDIGMGATAALKGTSGSQSRVGELSQLQFMKDCEIALPNVCKKILDKCPLKYHLVRNMTCLDPNKMYSEPDECLQKIKGLIQKFVQDKQLSSLTVEDQFRLWARAESFKDFSPTEPNSRVNMLLHQHMSTSAPELWGFVKKLLILSHGQATVERGFSINKLVETCNMDEETVVAQRLICDHVRVYGAVTQVPLTKELVNYCATARTRYRMYLRKKTKDEQMTKRKIAEDELEVQRKKRRTIHSVCETLKKDSDSFAEKAESTTGTKMAELITKSNTLRRRYKEKRDELDELDKEIERKASELREI
ncbi:Alanine--tRNA ligase [Labeo rohita]|uniref:Alanine--tRNA ligase n=1 Tax=Labeo rohita TaxID=84645 RepID=A0ABQ8L4D8_LABRO|nr:Alanine--tRNA ligase [Labeo rohita]